MYLDTAYVAKCYLNEPDAAAVRRLVAGRSDLTSSAFCLAELACVVQRHVRERGLTRAQATRLRRLFDEDVRDGVWTLLPISAPLLSEVQRRVAALPPSVYVRAGDALHLVSASEAGHAEVWTNDRHMLAAASHLGVRGRSV